MAKKNDNLLLYGAAAVAAYFLFIKPKTATPAVVPTNTAFVPNTGIVPPVSQQNPVLALATNATNLIKDIFKTVSPAADTPRAPLINEDDDFTEGQIANIPGSPMQTFTPLEIAFQSGKYPGHQLSGTKFEAMHQ